MNMCIATAVGYLFYRTERLLQREKLSFTDFAGLPGSGILLWLVLWIAIMGLALVVSMSRMGIAALFGSVACMVLAAKAAYSRKRVRVIALTLVFGIVGLAVYAGVDEVIARYEAVPGQLQSDRDRLALWKDAWPLIEQRPVLGSGLGTFRWTHPSYESVRPDTPARYAHNDYLQALSEVGIIGFCLMVWAYGAAWRIAYRNFKNSIDPLVRGIGLGTMGVLGALALQEFTDFGLYIPGVSLTAALLVGLNLRARNLGSPQNQ
jgi:O-antigen ligase